MGATASAPFKAMSMTNANMSREFSYGPSGNAGAVAAPNASAPSARRNRRLANNAAVMMAGGKRRKTRRSRKSKKGTYRRRR